MRCCSIMFFWRAVIPHATVIGSASTGCAPTVHATRWWGARLATSISSDAEGGAGDEASEVTAVERAPVPVSAVEWRSARGSGPGGQAANSSSNKAELRINLRLWSQLEPDVMTDRVLASLKRHHEKHIAQQDILIIQSHAHRSLERNRNECLERAQRIIHEASYVAPAPEAAPHYDPRLKRIAVAKKKVQSNFNRLRRDVRQGKF